MKQIILQTPTTRNWYWTKLQSFWLKLFILLLPVRIDSFDGPLPMIGI